MRYNHFKGLVQSAFLLISSLCLWSSPSFADPPREMIRVEGDSYAAGVYGFGLALSLAKTYDVVVTATGGSSHNDILNRMTGATPITSASVLHWDGSKYIVTKMIDNGNPLNAQLNSLHTVIWDGHPNGLSTNNPAWYVSTMQNVVSQLTAGYTLITSVASGNSTTGIPDLWSKSVNKAAELMAAADMNIIEAFPILAGLADGSTADSLNVQAGYVPPSLRANNPSDLYHLNGKAMDAIAQAVVQSRTVQVPGPEAGAGLGAVAVFGLAALLRRRRKTA